MAEGEIVALREIARALDVLTNRLDLLARLSPAKLKAYTVAGVPAAADNTYAQVFITNETGGATVAFSDGTNWRRVQDRAIIA